MIRTIKKGEVLTSIQCSNGFFSNNLYCENIKIKSDDTNRTLTLSLDYSGQYRKRTWDKDDFDEFVSYIDKLDSISFNNKYATTNIKNYFRHSDKKKDYNRQVELLIDKSYVLDAALSVTRTDNFEIKIKNAKR